MLLTKKQSAKLGNLAAAMNKEIHRLIKLSEPIDGDIWIGVYASDLDKIDELTQLVHEDSGFLTTRGNYLFMKAEDSEGAA